MIDIALKAVMDKLPVAELAQSLDTFLSPLYAMLPDRRLDKVVALSVRGIIGSESPVVTQMAQSVARTESGVWAAAKQIYRLLGNERVAVAELSQGLSDLSQVRVKEVDPAYVVVAVDPVNFEKPYTTELAGVSTVHKSTPPQLNGQVRLTRGYPALTATVVNTPVPAVTYAHWFSYTTDFISQNWEINQAISATNQLLSDYKRRYVADLRLRAVQVCWPG